MNKSVPDVCKYDIENDSVTIDAHGLSFGGNLRAIASKSHAHRVLIAASLSDTPVTMLTPDSSKDIEATRKSLIGLGADIKRSSDSYLVTPISQAKSSALLSKQDEGSSMPVHKIDVGESGSTLRFLIPVIGALGINTEITMHGRLSERPLSPMYEELIGHGLTMSPQGSNPMKISGQISAGKYTIAGNISSQFVTGLLFALPLVKSDGNSRNSETAENSDKGIAQGTSTLHVTGKLESRPYVDITLNVLRTFGIVINEETLPNGDTLFIIPADQTYHTASAIRVDGDWSNAAFFLVAGAIGKKPVTVSGLNMDSLQGDKKILNLLEEFGADVSVTTDELGHSVTVSPAALRSITIDASDIPDLIPIISVVAALAEGTTVIRNYERLRIKESDRVQTIIHTLSSLGINIYEKENVLYIQGSHTFSSCTVDSFNDHRIAMSAAIAAIRADGPVVIKDPMAVQKSYPGFYEDLKNLFQSELI